MNLQSKTAALLSMSVQAFLHNVDPSYAEPVKDVWCEQHRPFLLSTMQMEPNSVFDLAKEAEEYIKKCSANAENSIVSQLVLVSKARDLDLESFPLNFSRLQESSEEAGSDLSLLYYWDFVIFLAQLGKIDGNLTDLREVMEQKTFDEKKERELHAILNATASIEEISDDRRRAMLALSDLSSALTGELLHSCGTLAFLSNQISRNLHQESICELRDLRDNISISLMANYEECVLAIDNLDRAISSQKELSKSSPDCQD